MLGRSGISPQHICPVHVVKHKVRYTTESPRNGIFIGVVATVQVNPTAFHRLSQTGIAHPVIIFTITIIQASLEHTVRPLVHTHHTRLQPHNFARNRAAIFYFSSADIGTFCSHQNYTICRFCTINSSRSIFQKVNGFDIVCIELGHLTDTAGRHTVNNQQRLYVILRNRTTNRDAPSLFARSSRRTSDA